MLLLTLEFVLLGRVLDVQVLEASIQVSLGGLDAANLQVLVFDLLPEVGDFVHLLVYLLVSPVHHVLLVVKLASIVFLLGSEVVKAYIFEADRLLKLADFLIQLGHGHLHALLNGVSLDLEGLDVVKVALDLLLLVPDLLASGNQLVLLLALVAF